MFFTRTVLLTAALLVGARPAAAQEPPPTPPAEQTQIQTTQTQTTQPLSGVTAKTAFRACDGCPLRDVGMSFLQNGLINVAYGLGNLARGEHTARVTPKTWWANMQQGMVWDLNDFAVNQVGHPWQGSNYFDAARANGLNFYESSALAAFGSATWEFFGETAHPSLNDFINTTLGGISLGEMLHRTGWLIRDPRATGKKRLWGEIGAAVVDPLTGLNRFMSGDSSRLTDKPPELVPSSIGGVVSAGALWRGSQSNAFSEPADPFLEVDAYYGDPNVGRSRTPYDAFWIRMRFGGGSTFSEARVRGRLFGQPIANGKYVFSVIQSYNYNNNDAYSTGSQAIDAAIGTTRELSPRTTFWVLGWAGVTVLGAVDSLPVGVSERPEDEEEAPGAPSSGPRYYDYGPGSDFGGLARLSRDGREFAMFFYVGRHLYSLDGVRANHFLQHLRVDLMFPLRGPLGLGTSFEYFHRRSSYQDAASTVNRYHYPQVRAYFTWWRR